MQFNPPTSCWLTLVLFGLSVQTLAGEEWSQFRGPHYGADSASVLPVQWSAGHVVWKTELPGPGASCPVILDDRIYLTCYTGYGVDRQDPGNPADLKRHVMCIDPRGGSVVWRQTVDARSSENIYNQWAVALHGYASSTPAVDETGVYVFLGDAGLYAFDHDGNQRWSVDCGSRNHIFGSGPSPVIYGDLVIVNASPESGDLIAVDKASGDEVWRVKGIDQAWNTPAIYRNENGQDELAISIKGKILAFNPRDGSELWSCQAIDDYICPSIIAQDGVVFAIGGRTSKTFAVRSGGSGDVTDTHILWELPKGSNVSSPVIHDGHIYWAKEQRGIVYCANIKSGELVYEQRLEPASGLIYASPVVSNGNLFYVSREKGTYVVAAKPEFELVAHNVIETDDSVFNASPVPHRDGVLLRSDKYLYFIRSQ